MNVKDSPLRVFRAGFGLPGPKVSIVALLFDQGAGLFELAAGCVKAIRDTAPADAEIIFVVNEPSSSLQDLLSSSQKEDQRVLVVSVGRNVGAVVRNLGYNLAQGEYIISLDSDVIVEKGWVEKFLTFMDANPAVGLSAPCGGRLRVEKWTPAVWPVGEFGEGEKSCFGYEDPEFFGAQTATGQDGTWLDSVPSMCWCFRSRLLKQIGYMDWRFSPFIGEDADFCFRVRMCGMGVSLVRVPVHHVRGGGSAHAVFGDFRAFVDDHIRELHDRWKPHAAKVCGLLTPK